MGKQFICMLLCMLQLCDLISFLGAAFPVAPYSRRMTVDYTDLLAASVIIRFVGVPVNVAVPPMLAE